MIAFYASDFGSGSTIKDLVHFHKKYLPAIAPLNF
jgi:hypothetical protein